MCDEEADQEQKELNPRHMGEGGCTREEETKLPWDPRWAHQQVWKVGVRTGNDNRGIK